MLEKFKVALLAFGPVGIFVLAVMDSLAVPLPGAIDGLVLYIAVKEPQKVYLTALMALLGSLLGNVILYKAARQGSNWIMPTGDSSPSRGRKFQEWFARYGMLTVFVPAVVPFVPFPLKFFVVSAGCLRVNFGKFVAVIVAARFLRFFGEAYLGLHLGAGAEAYLHRNAWTLLGGVVLLAVAVYFVIRLNDHRDASVL